MGITLRLVSVGSKSTCALVVCDRETIEQAGGLSILYDIQARCNFHLFLNYLFFLNKNIFIKF